MTTKILALTDALGNLARFILLPGQRFSDIAEIDGSSAIVEAVVNIAAARNMTTTAESVETLEQKELLRALGCSPTRLTR